MLAREVLEGLFDKKKIKILRFFVNKADEEFYLREVSKHTGVSSATTFRVVNQLLKMQVLEVKQIKKLKLYKLGNNPEATILKDLLEEKKSAVQEFVEFVSALPSVERIILHGKESRDKTNVLIIGNNVDAGAVKQKVGEIKDKNKISIIELNLTADQFHQMSVMGLFPGSKKLLWSRNG